MNNEWKEKIAEAGKQFDGHVTNGSLEKMTYVVDQMLTEQKKAADELFAAFVYDLRQIGLQCLDGGHKNRNRMFQSLADRYKYVYETEDMSVLQKRFIDRKGYK